MKGEVKGRSLAMLLLDASSVLCEEDKGLNHPPFFSGAGGVEGSSHKTPGENLRGAQVCVAPRTMEVPVMTQFKEA